MRLKSIGYRYHKKTAGNAGEHQSYFRGFGIYPASQKLSDFSDR